MPYHRHSLPQRSVEFTNNSYHFTPSTNYTIPSSEEKRSGQRQMMGTNMSMNVLSPIPFGKDPQNNSYDGINKIEEASYATYQKEGLLDSGSYFNNTMPLPDMASFVPKSSYSPDVCMQQPYLYYNPNSGSTGRISNNSDYFPGPQPQPTFYEGTVGKSWPKIPHSQQAQIDKYSTIPGGYRRKGGRVITKERPDQKEKYKLDFERIILGDDRSTSLMVRNIPNKYNQTMLTQELDENHKGLYDYLYLPIDPKNKCNYGYAFINLVHPYIILSLYKEFNGKSWKKFNSEKICELTYGRLQGRESLLKHLVGSGVMQQSDPSKKPLILDSAPLSEELLKKIKEDFIQTYGFP
mmetsp:Transcript_5963/g.6725  ORF Transcript_5963/g.6725 Transcript_5963/m.6725 type:complete len:351 (+) Transcript_5963:588-1640(+)